MISGTPRIPSYPQRFAIVSDARFNLLYAVGALWGLMIVAIVGLFWYADGFAGSRDYYYLLPWCFATGAVVISPILYSVYKQPFDPFHPLVYASWSYFLPGFFIGGLTLAFGASQPYYLAFVLDEQYNLPLTFVYVMIGFGALMLGFALPFGRKIGEAISKKLPVWNWNSQQVMKPALVLLIIGLANTAIAFAYGILGYQKVDELGSYDGIIFLLSMFWLEASFLLWLCVFRAKELNTTHFLVIAVLLFTSITKSAFQGNRGSLITNFTLVACAYVCSGKKIGLKQTFVGGLIICVALIVGMLYGTTFRGLKQTQDRMEMTQYAGLIGSTLGTITEQNPVENLSKAFGTLADRLDSISPLAVIVSNHEKLLPYEEGWALANNIIVESTTFFIPRVFWTEKPITTEASKYGDLYFGYADNSFTMTPMGDLLRNFGPWGIPLGMIFLGFLLRVIYATLRENQPFSFWRPTLFFMLLTIVSYEGTFGMIVPYLFKVGVFSVFGLLIIRFLAGPGDSRPAAA